jgi:heme/copper-type cytochrome/quinol oxidase subunit 3
MTFPLSIFDFSLWLAITAIVLLITSELFLSSTTYFANIALNRKRLRLVALAMGAGFMITVVMRIFQPM